MEWLWHVDEDDAPIGRVERDDAHASAVRHRSGIVFLLDALQRVYLVRRSASKAIFPSRYDSSSSFHVAYGESYSTAARREAFEELGLDEPLDQIGKFRHDDPPEHQFVGVFVMRYENEPLILDPTEATSGAFCSLTEAARVADEELCTPWLRIGVQMLIQRVRASEPSG